MCAMSEVDDNILILPPKLYVEFIKYPRITVYRFPVVTSGVDFSPENIVEGKDTDDVLISLKNARNLGLDHPRDIIYLVGNK